MKTKLFKILLISLMLLGLIIPNLSLNQLSQLKNQALANETGNVQESLPEELKFREYCRLLFDNDLEKLWRCEFLMDQILQEGQVQDIYSFLLNFPWDDLKLERAPDGTISFKSSKSIPLSSNSSQDVDPPQLIEFNFTPKNINTNIGLQTVTFTLRITDNLSGLNFAEWAVLSPSGQQHRWGTATEYQRISGDELDGVYQYTIEFPQYSEAGTWYVYGIYLVDKVGNSRWLYEQDLINLGFSTKLEVIGADITPPQLKEFEFTPKTINTSQSPQIVTFTLRITDNLSGLNFAEWGVLSPSGQQSGWGAVAEWQRISGDELDGVYQGTIEFPQYSEAGTWYVTGAYLFDKVGNRKGLSEQDFIDLGFPTKLEVVSIPSDTVSPQLQEFSFSPTYINTSESSQTVTFILRITDNLSGLNLADWAVLSPSGQQSRWGEVTKYQRISGDELDGVYQGTIEFPQYSEVGTWHVNAVWLTDKVGNDKWLWEQDLISLGFPTELVNSLEVPVNQPPTFSNLNQYKSDKTTFISEGSTTTESTVVFKAIVSDPDNDQVKLQVQIKEVGQGWQDILKSNLVDSGSEAIVTKYGLIENQYRWQARAVDEKGAISGDWQEFGKVGNVDFEVRLVPLYIQQNLPWGIEDYAYATEEDSYRCGWRIGDCGCSITSMVMLGRYYDIDTAINNSNVDPGGINTWLINPNNEGYQLDGDLWWGKSIEYLGFTNETTGQTMVRLNLDRHNASTSIKWQEEEIDSYINSSQPAVAYHTGHGHYFIIDNKIRVGPNDYTYTLKDPKWYNTKKLNQPRDIKKHIQGYANHFDTANLFSYLETPRPITPSIDLDLNSPAELLVIDPLGRKLGKDPVTGITYNEIPDASYTKEGPIVSSDTPLDPSEISESKAIHIPSLAVGEYDVKVIGTDLGTYTLNSLAYNETGESIVRNFDKMVIDTGVVSDYKVVYSSIPEEPVIIERVVVSEDVITEVETARQLDLIDNDGVKNSLLQKLDNAQKQIEKNKYKTAINTLNAIINEIEVQKGKHIDSDFAEVLIEDTQYLIEDLRSSVSDKNKNVIAILFAISGVALTIGSIFVVRKKRLLRFKKKK